MAKKIRQVVRKGKFVSEKDNLVDNSYSEKSIEKTNLNSKTNSKEAMDNKFDDVLKVNANNTSSDLYQRYLKVKEESDKKEENSLSDIYQNNSSFYSALKSPEELARDKQGNKIAPQEVVKEKDPTELEGEPQVIFDLFNLNRDLPKQSTEANIIREKKLVNDGKQNIINDKNKIETVNIKQEPTYAFQNPNEEINYQDAFKGLRQHKEKTSLRNKFENSISNNSPVTTVDLKNKIYSAGFKIRSYQKLDNENYYFMRYYLSNKLNRDCSIISSFLMILLMGIMWLAFDAFVKLPMYVYIGMMASFLVLPLVFVTKYLINPKVRKPANFSFKLTILNAIMIYLLGLVVALLVSFFAVGADISDISTLVCPLIYPLIYMLVIPIYVLVYQLLYITKRYYIE